VEAADQEAVALVLEELEDIAAVLPHQDRVGRIVVDAEGVAAAWRLRDRAGGNPQSRA
jgi:cell division FtsZ-interacting protein ZapD